MKNKKIAETMGFVLLLILITAQAIYFGFQKKGYHVDEMFSYGLANSNYMPFMHMGDDGSYDVADFMQEYGTGNNPIELFRNLGRGVVDFSKAHFRFQNMEMYDAYRTAAETSKDTKTTTWLTGQYFKDYLTVEEGTRFNLPSVYYNQRGDVHPPFYYMLLNAVSSIFAGRFSKWFGFAVNYIVLMITLILLYRMVKNHLGNYCTAMMAVGIYGFSSGFLTTMVFFRMYATLTMWTVAMCYFHLYLQKHDFVMTKKKRSALTALIFFGFYTQYFYVIYAGTMMLSVIGYLIGKKRGKEIWSYARCYLRAAIIGVAVWPFAIKHIFFGYQGSSVRASLTGGNVLHKLGRMLNEFAICCFGGSKVLMYVIIALGITCYVVSLIRNRKKKKPVIMRYVITFLPAMVYFVLISLSVSIMVERYVMNVMPFAALFTALLLGHLCRQLPKIGKTAYAMLPTGALALGIAVWTCGLVHRPEYLDVDYQENIEIPEHTVCVYVMPDGYWGEFHKDALVLSKCEKVAVIYESNLEYLTNYTYESGQTVMVYMSPFINQKQTLETVRRNMGIENLRETEFQLDMSYYQRRMYQE